MEENQFNRLEMLIGKKNLDLLKTKTIAIFGLGGVGGHCIDALVRSGIGKVILIDHDVVSLSNINRQLIANHETIGKKKVEVMKEHLLKINPFLIIETHDMFYDENSFLDLTNVSYVIDAIDSIKSKVHLITYCINNNIPIISSMGAGNKLDPTQIEVSDIYQTSYCPLAKKMRQELKKRNIKHLKVTYSKEINKKKEEKENQKRVPSSFIGVTASMGLVIASFVLKELIEE